MTHVGIAGFDGLPVYSCIHVVGLLNIYASRLQVILSLLIIFR